MNEAFRTIIVSDAYVALARQITETLAPVGGRGMYSTGLSPNGTAPATHWISSGFIDADYAALLPLIEYKEDAGTWIENWLNAGYPEMIVQMCADAEFDVALTDVEALLDAADVTTEQPFTALARLGLQIIQTEERF
jgi:hypothetical protein